MLFDKQAKMRHELAVNMLEKAMSLNYILTLQALSEFFYACTRKGIMPNPRGLGSKKDWQTLFPVAVAKPNTLNRAIVMGRALSMGFWDAMLLETARSAGRICYFYWKSARWPRNRA